jgi:hypothetical protein
MKNENAGMDFGGWLFFQTISNNCSGEPSQICILTISKAQHMKQ